MGQQFKPIMRHSLLEAHVKVIQRAQRAKWWHRGWEAELAALPLFHIKHTAMSLELTGHMVRRHRDRSASIVSLLDKEGLDGEVLEGRPREAPSKSKGSLYKMKHPPSYYHAAARFIQLRWAVAKGIEREGLTPPETPAKIAAAYYAKNPTRNHSAHFHGVHAAAVMIAAHIRAHVLRVQVKKAKSLTPGAFLHHHMSVIKSSSRPTSPNPVVAGADESLPALHFGEEVYGMRWCRGRVVSVLPDGSVSRASSEPSGSNAPRPPHALMVGVRHASPGSHPMREVDAGGGCGRWRSLERRGCRRVQQGWVCSRAGCAAGLGGG